MRRNETAVDGLHRLEQDGLWFKDMARGEETKSAPRGSTPPARCSVAREKNA